MLNLQSLIIYQDDDIFVINKPTMLHSVMLNKTDSSESLASFLLQEIPSLAFVSNKKEDAGLLQRLDFETSGCILGAKNNHTWQKLFQILKNGEIKKDYLAIVLGNFNQSQKLDTFIGTKGRHSHKVQIILNDRQKRTLPASSKFFPITYNKNLNLSLVRAEAPTARRHQIRAHLAYLGFPLLGDTLYGSKQNFFLDSDRKFFLHASTLTFKHPNSGKLLEIKASEVKYF